MLQVGLVRRRRPAVLQVGLVRRRRPAVLQVGLVRRRRPAVLQVGLVRRRGPPRLQVEGSVVIGLAEFEFELPMAVAAHVVAPKLKGPDFGQVGG